MNTHHMLSDRLEIQGYVLTCSSFPAAVLSSNGENAVHVSPSSMAFTWLSTAGLTSSASGASPASGSSSSLEATLPG